jgi:hypothetical protein
MFILFILAVILYTLYTARHIILGPHISFSNTQDDILKTTVQVVKIAGQTQNTTELRLNNRKIILNQDGDFSERMLLTPGVNVFIFNAKDKFDRTEQKMLQIVYTPTKDMILKMENNKKITNKETFNKQKHGKKERKGREE